MLPMDILSTVVLPHSQRYVISRVLSVLSVSVGQTSVFHQNGCTYQVDLHVYHSVF